MARNRITVTQFLPAHMANLDLHSFDSSNLSELVVNSTKFHDRGSYQRNSRSRETSSDRRNQGDRRQRSNERGRQNDKGSSPGRRDVRQRNTSYHDKYSRGGHKNRGRSSSRNRNERFGIFKRDNYNLQNKNRTCRRLDYCEAQCPLGCSLFHSEKPCQ